MTTKYNNCENIFCVDNFKIVQYNNSVENGKEVSR